MRNKNGSLGNTPDASATLLQVVVPHRDPVTHTIPLEFLDQDLELRILDSDEILAGNYLGLSVNGVALGTRYYVTESDKTEAQNDPDFSYRMSIDKALYPADGTSAAFSLDYFVGGAGGERLSNLPLEIVLDREPPGGTTLPFLSFTPQQMEGIGQIDLTGDLLEVRVPLWFGKAVGDVLTPWLGTSETQGILLTESAVTVTDVAEPIFARFPKALLMSNGDITQYFAYQLADPLGNESAISRSRAIPVSLTRSIPKKIIRFKKNKVTSVGRGVATLAGLPALTPPSTVFPDGTIPVALLAADLQITIPNAVPEFPEQSLIQLYRIAEDGQRTPLGAARTITAAESADPAFVFDLAIPLAEFPATGTTQWTLDYSVFDPLSGGGPLSGKPVKVIFDREPPGGSVPADMPLLEFTPEQLSGITLADVVGGILSVLLPAWYQSATGDIVEVWVSNSDAPDDTKYLANTFTLPIGGDGVKVEFPVADIQPLGNGTLYFAYRLKDKAGNISVRSNSVAIPVLLTDAPTNLLAPVVPDYLDHGVITQKDAAERVEVEITSFDNAQSGDRFYVIWGATIMPPETLLTSDLNPPAGTPLKTIRLPYQEVLKEGNGIGKEVRYQVWRGSLLADTSPPTTVDVNLDTPGPDPDPDPDTPWHENLLPVVVVSDSGNGTGGDNVIPPGDFNKAAQATVPYLGQDGKVIWKAGDRVQISWDGALVGSPLPITSANQNADLVVSIPAGTVGASAGLKNVFYVVSRDLLPGTEVATAQSKPTEVNVQSPGLLPGDGSLAKVIFPEEDVPLNVVNRTTGGLDGTPIRINLAGVTNIKANDSINLTFVGRQSLTAATAPIIAGTEYTVTDHRITTQELTRGYYELDIPYNPYLQKICRNGCTVDYSITNAVGQPVDADQKFIRIVLDQPGSIGVCAINP
jgi:hypothetical protein